ncbi:MAG: hypothetical protein RL026_2204 [Pseudomonadota bacterium]|jgi:Holliday junction DNA helicase RuvA
MIATLDGILLDKSPPRLVLDVAGVGYDIEAPMSTFYPLPATGARVRLFIHQVIREDAWLLFGFLTARERELFRNVLKVTGVGPRIALAILSSASEDSFAQWVHAQDVAALTRIPGVGRKIAERLVIEMKDRLSAPGQSPVAGLVPVDTPVGEAAAALVALGFKPPEASRMVKAVEEDGMSTEDLIRRALQGAARD